MQIRAFQLHNYGRFESLSASFMENESTPAKVVVLVGNNGAGKTTILKALATSLSWLVGKVRSERGVGKPIADHAILNGASSAAIQLFMTDDSTSDSPLQWIIGRSRTGRKIEIPSQLHDAATLAQNYRTQLTEHERSSLPLIAYYPVERSVLETPLKISKKNAFDQISGYDEFMNPKVNFNNFFDWFRDREDYENQQASEALTHFKSYASTERDFLQSVADKMKEEASVKYQELEPRHWNLLEAVGQVLAEQAKALSKSTQDSQLSAVRKAIEIFMPGFSNLRVDRKPHLQLIVDKNDQSMNILQLSQGEKTLMALVGDVARRLAMMNPGLENPLHGDGIVLIDEVDMHLHPTWQRDIIRNLTRTFPNCQFILTTHSPLVISDYPDVLVFSLNDSQLDRVPSQFGQDANTVLLDVMDTHVRNRDIGVQLNDALDAIQDGRLEDARKIIDALEAQLPPSNLELAKAKLFLRKQELRFEKNR